MLCWLAVWGLVVAVGAFPVEWAEEADEVECGVSPAVAKYSNGDSANRILGGHPSVDGDWPWVIRVGGCTGSIVSRYWVLTAAHCGIKPNLEVGFGSASMYEMSKVRVVKAITSPLFYERGDFSFDIALLKVESPFDFNVTTPLCLQRNLPSTGSTVAAGFGMDDEHGALRRQNLWEARVPLAAHPHCRQHDTSFVCAGGVQAGTTRGDSGGPLMQLHNGRFVSLGITSYGYYIEFPSDPFAKVDMGVYTRTPFYCDWIEENTDGEVVCRD